MQSITFHEEAQCEGWIEKIGTKSEAVTNEPSLTADLSSQIAQPFLFGLRIVLHFPHLNIRELA